VSRFALAVGALTVLAATVRFVGLGHQGFWFDEADTVSILHTSLGGVLGRVPRWETTPPVYFILAWLWTHVFGDGEAGLRSLSALAGTLTVPIGYAVGKQLLSRRVGVIVAALVACNPLLVWYSQEARAYALLVLFTSIALLAFVHLRTSATYRWTITWAIAAALAMATHYYAAVAIVPEAIWLLAHHRRRRQIRIAVVAIVVWGLPMALLAVRQLRNIGLNNWINRIPFVHRAGDLPKEFLLGPSAPASPWLLLGSALLVGLSVWLVIGRGSRDERRTMVPVVQIAAGGFVLILALVLLGFDQVNTRNLLALWLPLAILVAAGFGVRRAPMLGVAGASALCAIGLATVTAVALNPHLQRPPWRAVARAIDSGTDHAVFEVNGCALVTMLSPYVPGLHVAPAAGAMEREIDVIVAAGQRNWYEVAFSGWYVVCEPQPRPVALPRRLGSFRAVGPPVRIGQFSVIRLRSPTPVKVSQSTFSAAGLRGNLTIAPGRS
jgi:4-amino-4-deoxy-L-arabinose transferase-like glycosyltransferase